MGPSVEEVAICIIVIIVNGAISKVFCTQLVSFHSARDDQAVAREVRPHALGARVAGSDPVAAHVWLDQLVGDGNLWQRNMESNLGFNNTVHIEKKKLTNDCMQIS